MASEKFSVKIESDLKDLIPAYLERREDEIVMLRDALNRQDFHTLEVIGHKLGGHAGSYGLIGLGKLGKNLEESAAKKNLQTAQVIIEDISQYLDRLLIEFD